MNQSSRISDREVTDMLRWRSTRPAPDGLAWGILESLASERAHDPARTTGRSAKRPLMLLAAAALLLAGGALAAGSGALRLWSITPPEPAPSFGPVDYPALTTTFVSPRNGFSIKHPGGVAVTPAKQLWGFSTQVDDGFDLLETGLGAVFKGASTGQALTGDIPASIDEKVDEWLSDDNVLPGGCGVPRSQQAGITIDGQSGRISECANRIDATVVVDERLYLFTLLKRQLVNGGDARALFDAYAATIDLTPETAVESIAWTTIFVSPTYGYSFMQGRGGFAPAAELWDPVNQRIDIDFDPRLDGFETGSSAYLEGASIELPDGVSIDEWVDEHVTPRAVGGCGVPRSQQAEITIDGQAARIAECANQIEATVVAGGRLYLFILGHSRPDARAFFDAWIATIDLRPEDAAVP